MTISGIENVGVNPEDQGVKVGKAGGEMGKDEFLRMLVTEMKNQDPLNPVDNKEMIAQLAQFSSLEQMKNVSAQVEGLRQETGLASAIGLTHQPVSAELKDGGTVTGVVSRVLWKEGKLILQINDQEYPTTNIVSLARVTEEV
jgi:flagellar basal-body rod modification protein FlgD